MDAGEGFFLLERHLHRLSRSAQHFEFVCPLEEVQDALERSVAAADRPLRVRLLVGRDGTVRTEAFHLEPSIGTMRVRLAAVPIDPTDPFFVSQDDLSNAAGTRALAGYDEIVLWNPDRFITEAINANIVVEVDGRAVTPPIECGLLGGNDAGRATREEGNLGGGRSRLRILQRAPRFWLINSVRGWRAASLAATPS